MSSLMVLGSGNRMSSCANMNCYEVTHSLQAAQLRIFVVEEKHLPPLDLQQGQSMHQPPGPQRDTGLLPTSLWIDNSVHNWSSTIELHVQWQGFVRETLGATSLLGRKE